MYRLTLFQLLTAPKAFAMGHLKILGAFVFGSFGIIVLLTTFITSIFTHISTTEQQVTIERIEREAANKEAQQTLNDIQHIIINHSNTIADVDTKVEKAVTLIDRLDHKLDQLTLATQPRTTRPSTQITNK